MRSVRQFGRDENGITLVESLLVMPIVILMMAAIVEFGFMLAQWNQAVKAMHIGARLAAVSSPIVTDISPLTADYPVAEGGPVPQDIIAVSCDVNTCDSDALDRLVTGGDGSCGPVPSGTASGICDVAPFLTADNIRITYIRSRLGYVGRPSGPLVTVKLELINKTFDFLALGSLIPGLSNIQFPPHSVTISSEDLNDCQDTCS